MTDDGLTVHERRRERDRVAAAARREAARESGEPMGHGLDALLIDGLALMLAGRDADDPLRVTFQRALSRAFHARRVRPSRAVAKRLQARLTVGVSLSNALVERRVEAEA